MRKFSNLCPVHLNPDRGVYLAFPRPQPIADVEGELPEGGRVVVMFDVREFVADETDAPPGRTLRHLAAVESDANRAVGADAALPPVGAQADDFDVGLGEVAGGVAVDLPVGIGNVEAGDEPTQLVASRFEVDSLCGRHAVPPRVCPTGRRDRQSVRSSVRSCIATPRYTGGDAIYLMYC